MLRNNTTFLRLPVVITSASRYAQASLLQSVGRSAACAVLPRWLQRVKTLTVRLSRAKGVGDRRRGEGWETRAGTSREKGCVSDVSRRLYNDAHLETDHDLDHLFLHQPL